MRDAVRYSGAFKLRLAKEAADGNRKRREAVGCERGETVVFSLGWGNRGILTDCRD
jgi:hypothetical protein